MGEAERGDAAPRVHISYWCSNGHETRPSFAQEPGMVLPETMTSRPEPAASHRDR